MATKGGIDLVAKKTAVDERQTTDGGERLSNAPYIADITIRGIAPILFHAWNNEAVEAKSRAPKNSLEKKSDNLESYVYRTTDGLLGIPGTAFAGALRGAGRYLQDPRSPRKSAMDLVRQAVVPLDDVALLIPKSTHWEYEDRRRVVVQRSAVTRTRPAMKEGWEATFGILVNLPEYISPETLCSLATEAGRTIGILDFRPTYGRFVVTGFTVRD